MPEAAPSPAPSPAPGGAPAVDGQPGPGHGVRAGTGAGACQTWDIFCRVVDNHGDLGVCWRLARGLAAQRGTAVRLWVDEPAALAWMAPDGAPGVQLLHWTPETPLPPPGQVVVEAFGCDPPAAFVARMASLARPPVWLNLEYLSAEAFVARSHGLPSPQMSGPGRGLTKWFYYPGFGPGTGGLMHGDGAAVPAPSPRQRGQWLRALGLADVADSVELAETGDLPTPCPPRWPGRLVLLFAYPSLPWPDLLAGLAAQGPGTLLLPPGALAQQLATRAGALPAGLRLRHLPMQAQPQFDVLLAVCDLAVVRGEDSFVRAQVASDAPFLWQIYPQHDGAHAAKLAAFLARYLADAPAGLATAWRPGPPRRPGLSPAPGARTSGPGASSCWPNPTC